MEAGGTWTHGVFSCRESSGARTKRAVRVNGLWLQGFTCRRRVVRDCGADAPPKSLSETQPQKQASNVPVSRASFALISGKSSGGRSRASCRIVMLGYSSTPWAPTMASPIATSMKGRTSICFRSWSMKVKVPYVPPSICTRLIIDVAVSARSRRMILHAGPQLTSRTYRSKADPSFRSSALPCCTQTSRLASCVGGSSKICPPLDEPPRAWPSDQGHR